MEKSDRRKLEEIVQGGLEDPVVYQAQKVDVDGLQQLQTNENTARNVASKICVIQKPPEPMKEKSETAQKVKTGDLLQKSEKESFQLEQRGLAEDWESEPQRNAITDTEVQQKDESSFSLKQDSNQSESDTVHRECDAFAEDKSVESHGNATAECEVETAESILRQESTIKSPQEDNDVVIQECVGNVDESLKPKLETNLKEQLEESSIASIKDPLQIAEQDTNHVLQQEWDRTTENDHFQESEFGSHLEESHCVSLRTRQQEDVAFLPLPNKICHPRTHMPQPRLPPVPDESDEPFEEEIVIRRIRRPLRASLPTTLPTGMGDYMQRVRERNISRERRALLQELQRRCIKLLYSLVISGIVLTILCLLIEFLESKYSSSDDLNINFTTPTLTFKPGTLTTDLEANVTTPLLDFDINIITSTVDFHTETIPLLNDTSSVTVSE